MKLSERNSPELKNLPKLIAQAPLPLDFFLRDAVTVARELLGKGLLIGKSANAVLVELTEVEAYLEGDPASHSYGGLSARNWPMFEQGGICYVYLCYGIHFCMNVVTGPKGHPEAVLFRAAAPILGQKTMAQRRRTEKDTHWLSGPGKLTQALGVDLRQNAVGFDSDDFKIIDLGNRFSSRNIVASPRIGISKAKTLPLRFHLRSSPWVSQ